jgi:hypothetical protein
MARGWRLIRLFLKDQRTEHRFSASSDFAVIAVAAENDSSYVSSGN